MDHSFTIGSSEGFQWISYSPQERRYHQPTGKALTPACRKGTITNPMDYLMTVLIHKDLLMFSQMFPTVAKTPLEPWQVTYEGR